MPEKGLKNVATKYHLTADQAAKILELLDGGFSIPYISRYHKELAGTLPPEGFRELAAERKRLEKLDAICFFGCEEYKDLKAAIEAYKSGAVSG